MDVRKWLDATTPSLPALHPSNGSAPPVPGDEPDARIRPAKRKHRQYPSDSSLLEVRSRKEQHTPRPADELRCARPLQSEVSHSTSLHSSKSSLSECYARRPRRKTRPERYVPQPKRDKKRGKHAHSKKNESKVSRRKARRKKSDRPGSDMVQSFQAKNVSGDRLTLKPREQYGIFNKGKSSTVTKGRGLPDLVFSEMRFLQKDDSRANALSKPEPCRKRNRREKSHKNDEEISAFFAAARPLAEVSGNSQVRNLHQKHHKRSPADHYVVDQRHEADVVLSTIEAAEKAPYLGFGSRGPQHKSTSYVSWSESVRAPSIPRQTLSVRGDEKLNRRDQVATSGGQHQNDASDPESDRVFAPNTAGTCAIAEEASFPSNAAPVSKVPHSRPCLGDRSTPQKPGGNGFTTCSRGGCAALPSSAPPFPRGTPADDRCAGLDNINLGRQSSVFRAGEVNDDRASTQFTPFRKSLSEHDSSSSFGGILQRCSSQLKHRHHVSTVPVSDGYIDERAHSTTMNEQHPAVHPPIIRNLSTVQFLDNPIRIPGTSHTRDRRPCGLPQHSYSQSCLNAHDVTEPLSCEHYEGHSDSIDMFGQAEQDWVDWDHDPVDLDEPEMPWPEHELLPDSTNQAVTGNAVRNGFWRPHRLY